MNHAATFGDLTPAERIAVRKIYRRFWARAYRQQRFNRQRARQDAYDDTLRIVRYIRSDLMEYARSAAWDVGIKL